MDKLQGYVQMGRGMIPTEPDGYWVCYDDAIAYIEQALIAERKAIVDSVNSLLRSTDSAEDVGWNNAIILISRQIEERGSEKEAQENH